MPQVDTLVISCIDFRFRPLIAQWIDQTLRQADLVALAGASKAVLDTDTTASILKQLELVITLHAVQTLIILDHMDCGAYGGSTQYAGKPAAEKHMHRKRLNEASRIIKELYPNLKIKTAIIDASGEVSA